MKMDSNFLTQYRAMNPVVNNSMFYGSQSEIISVPDRMVGLIIGKGGEQIANIQNESECRIQFAPDSHGLQERQCTLTGTVEAILKAKDLITQIMSKGHDLPPDLQNGSQTIEVMIPGNKAGIIIGKGGETIKQLQEQAGVRMVIIQENNTPTNYDKPLRISGDRISCQKAKELVMGLLADKDIQLGGNSSFGGNSSSGGVGGGDYTNGSQRSSIDILVPRSMIGIVIGKGGEMIKKIQQESGARIQFRPDDESGGPNRLCSITGNHEQMSAATILMNDILDRQGAEMGWARSKVDRSRFNGSADEITFSVPADKCGLVIGKGGETIREICRLSGAHVELNRDQSTNQPERVFRIQGNNDQTQNAIRLISEKAGITAPVGIKEVSNMLSNHSISGGSYDENGTMNGNGHQQQQHSMSQLATSLSQQQQQLNNAAQQQNSVQQQNSLQQQNNLQQQNTLQQQNSLQQMMAQPALAQQTLLQQQTLQQQILQQQTLQQLLQQQQQQQALAALQAWPNNALHYNAQPLQALQQTTPMDSVRQITDTAQWAAYLYQQQQQQQQQQQLTQLTQQPYATNITRASLSSPASINPQTGQPDYTLQWADYYRQQGLHQQAQAILQGSTGQINQ